MNQPTEDRIKHLEEEQRQLKEGQKRLEEEMRQLREQRTEEIKAVRVEVASEDVINRLKTLEEDTTVLKEDTAVLKIQTQGARADILRIGESQADLRDKLVEHSEDLKVIKEKQEAHTEILGQLVNIGEGHTKRFDRVDETMATKDDITRVEKTQAEQGDLLKMILAELRKSRGQ